MALLEMAASDYAGNLGSFRLQLFEVGGALRPCLVRTVMHRDADRHDVVRVVAERRVHQAHEAFDGRAGAGQHQQRECDLAADQRIVYSAASATPWWSCVCWTA